MIDLHSHILQKIDDGPQIVEESLKMARAYIENGYRIIAATPHMIPGTGWMPSTDLVKREVSALNRSIEKKGLKIKIIPGMEVALDPQIPDLLDEGQLLCLGESSYLLIEPPFQQLPPRWERIIFSVLSKGYSILLAHPERCEQLADKPRLIEQLIETGVHLQVNWGSLIGSYGRAVARTARIMVGSGWIHCLATDSHSQRDLDSFEMQAAKDTLRDLIGPDNLRLLTFENPMKVLCGEVPRAIKKVDLAEKRKKARSWQFWKRKNKRPVPINSWQ